jgi:hypothetical protein
MFALHMGWRHLLFANWPVSPEIVRPQIPDALAVDTYDATAWLSIVPYVNVDVRPHRVPRGLGFRLPELNLRTYVVPDDEASGEAPTADETAADETTTERKPGVYFFSLDAGGLPGIGLAGVLGARLFHHLPYYYGDVDLCASDRAGSEDTRVRFESQRRHPGARPVRFSATYSPAGGTFEADPDSLAEFLTERYRFYTEAPSGALRYADVHHERWPLADADAEIRANTLFRANGFDHPEGDPYCLYSPGVDVLTSRSREWRRPAIEPDSRA